MDEFEYSGILSQDLFLEAQWMHLGKRRVVLWLFPFGMTIYALMSQSPLSLYIFIPIVFALGSLFPLAFSRLINRHWRSLHSQSPYLHEPFSASITDDGINFNSKSTSGVIPWSNFIKIKESENMFLLYQAPNLYNIVAKEFFSSPEIWYVAKRFLHENIK